MPPWGALGCCKTDAALLRVLLPLGERLCHAEADPEARAAQHRIALAAVAAALGHPFARTHHRLAGSELLIVLHVAAHHAQLRGVLVHGLELLFAVGQPKWALHSRANGSDSQPLGSRARLWRGRMSACRA
jgi:hypothetical protein